MKVPYLTMVSIESIFFFEPYNILPGKKCDVPLPCLKKSRRVAEPQGFWWLPELWQGAQMVDIVS